MRLQTKFGFTMAVILAGSLGFVSMTHAAPLAGMSAAVPAVQVTQEPSAAEALPEKAYHHPYHHPYHRPYHHPY